MTKKSNRKVFIIGGIAAAFMFVFCFAMVPLYGLICKKTGINTTAANIVLITKTEADAISKTIDMTREISVQFTATNNMGMPWEFYPMVKSVRVHPGEKGKVYFFAKNPTDKKMIAQAIPSMTPTPSITHFHKIECFCFNQQTLDAHESREMALVFQIDKDLPKDIHVITLAYTLYNVTPDETKKG